MGIVIILIIYMQKFVFLILYVKVFNLMWRTNETRFMKCHEKCKCKCKLDAIVCNNTLE